MLKQLFFFFLFFLIVFCDSNSTTSSNSSSNATNSTLNSTNTTNIITSNNNTSCNGDFYTAARFTKWGLQRPPYLATAAVSSNLTYCKMFNNISSCCDNSTDQAIANYYSTYKSVLANITSGRMNQIKTVFNQYKNISIDPSVVNQSSDLNNTIQSIIYDIKNNWIQVNQQMVSCAQGALKLSVGLLCTGCSPNTTNQVNGQLILNKGACLNLSLNCFKLVQSLNNTQNTSRDDAMNLTDALTTFVGDPVIDTSNTSNSSGIFGDVSDVNLSSNTSQRRFLDNTNNDNVSNGSAQPATNTDLNYEDPGLVINQTIVAFMKVFPRMQQSDFIICTPNIPDNQTKALCDTNPLMLHWQDTNASQAVFQAFQNNSQWAFVPIFANITLQCPSSRRLLDGATTSSNNGSNSSNSTNGLSTNFSNMTINNSNQASFELHFFFTHSQPNQDLLKFLLSKNPCITKLNKINETEQTIMNQLQQFIAFANISNKLGPNKQIKDQNSLMQNMGANDQFLTCIFQQLQNIFQTINKNIYNATCDFNITDSRSGNNVALCNQSFSVSVNQTIYSCITSPANDFTNLSGTCSNSTCIICLDTQCFSQQFSYQKADPSTFVNYTQDQAVQQFQADPRVSLLTGKRIPDFIALPDISFLTNYNFTPPCNDPDSCAQWFCTQFLRGPVARIEKIYNPQDSNDTLDQNAIAGYTTTTSSRILQTTNSSSDVTMSNDTSSGVDFNQVASQSGLDSTVSIDGVNTTADAYVSNNATDISAAINTTNGTSGSFGVRMNVIITLVMVILIVIL